MNINAIPYRSDNTERVEVTPINIATHASNRPAAKTVTPWSLSHLSVPLVRVSADLVLLLTGAMIGGMLGHLLQRTQSFRTPGLSNLSSDLSFIPALFYVSFKVITPILVFAAFFT